VRGANDATIRAGRTLTGSGSRLVKFAFGNNQDRKLAELSDDKFTVVSQPGMIVFKDGSKLELPKD
jgi:hypothetical protein